MAPFAFIANPNRENGGIIAGRQPQVVVLSDSVVNVLR